MYKPCILNSKLGDERRFRYIKYYYFHYYFYCKIEHSLLELLFAWRNLLSLAIFQYHYAFLYVRQQGLWRRKRCRMHKTGWKESCYYQNLSDLTAASLCHESSEPPVPFLRNSHTFVTRWLAVERLTSEDTQGYLPAGSTLIHKHQT